MLQLVYKDSFQAVELEEQYLEGQYHLAYLHGKGRHFVPVLVPLDCVPAIELLIAHRGRNGLVMTINSSSRVAVSIKYNFVKCNQFITKGSS